jgi:hypothetical protein
MYVVSLFWRCRVGTFFVGQGGVEVSVSIVSRMRLHDPLSRATARMARVGFAVGAFAGAAVGFAVLAIAASIAGPRWQAHVHEMVFMASLFAAASLACLLTAILVGMFRVPPE